MPSSALWRDPGYRLTWSRGQPSPADPEAHLTGHHAEALLLLGVRVAARHSPAGGQLEVPHKQGAAGLGAARADHNPLTTQRVLDDVLFAIHRCLLRS